jgi:hypothetical protein
MGKLEGLEELLAGRHFDREAIILQCADIFGAS